MNSAGRRATVGGLLAAVAVLAGCGSTVDGTAVAGSQSVSGDPSSSAESPTTPPTTGEPTGDTDGKTPPGTTLTVGETAVVDHTGDEESIGLVKITVDGIEEGDIADLESFDLDDEVKDSTPYYVRATFENVDLASGGNPGVSMIGADDGGERQRPVILFGTFDKCPSGNTSGEDFTPGNSYDTCMTYLINPGSTLAAVEYSQVGTDYFQSPVVWEP